MAFVSQTNMAQHVNIRRDPSMALLWRTLGFIYAVSVVYWPVIQSYLPSELGLLRAFDICTVILLGMVIINTLILRRPILLNSSILLGLFLIVLARFLSVLFSPHISVALFWSIFNYIEAFVVVWAFMALRTEVFERALIWTLVIITIIETLVGVVQVIASGGLQAGTGLASGRGVYELQILFVLWGLLSLIAGDGKPSANILKVFLGTLGVIITVIRTASIQLAIAIIVVYLLINKTSRRFYSRIVISGVVMVAIIISATQLQWPLLVTRLQQIGTMSGTIGARLVIWQAALFAFQLYPITGIGSGAFGRNQLLYFDGADVWFRDGYDDIGLSAHNTVVGFMAETGLIGLAAYLFYAVATISIARHLSKISPTTFHISLAGTVISGILIDAIAGSSFHPITMTLVALAASRYAKYKNHATASNLEEVPQQKGFLLLGEQEA